MQQVIFIADQPNLDRLFLPCIQHLAQRNTQIRVFLAGAGQAAPFNKQGLHPFSDPQELKAILSSPGKRVLVTGADLYFSHTIGPEAVLLCKAVDVPTFSIEHVSFAAYQDRFLRHHLFASRKIALFGHKDREKYLAMGQPEEKLVVTGSPLFDPYPCLLNKASRKKPGKYITFFGVNHRFVSKQSIFNYPQKKWVSFLNQLFSALLEALPGHHLLIKPHPAEPFWGLDQLYLQAAEQRLQTRITILPTTANNPHLILESDLIMTFSPSLMLESLLLGRPCLFLDSYEEQPQRNQEFSRNGALICQISPDLTLPQKLPHLLTITRSKDHLKVNQEFIASYAYKLDGLAGQRISDEIMHTLDQCPRRRRFWQITSRALYNRSGLHCTRAIKPVSIIMPVHNRAELTQSCLQAIIRKTPADRFEIIIIDNASTDLTPKLLSGLDGDVTIISNTENLGFAKACNQGAELAKGSHLLFLNNDTLPQTNWLGPMVYRTETQSSKGGIGITGSRLLYPNGSIQHAGIGIETDHTKLILHELYKGFPGNYPPANIPREMQAVTGACLCISRDLFLALDGFDEAFINGCEDIDLCFRARQAGYGVFYEPKSTLIHLEGQTPGRNTHNITNLKLLAERWAGRVKSDYLQLLNPASEQTTE